MYKLFLLGSLYAVIASFGPSPLLQVEEIPSAAVLDVLRRDVRSGTATAERTYLLGLYTYYELGVGGGSGGGGGGVNDGVRSLFSSAAERGHAAAALALGLLAEEGGGGGSSSPDFRSAVVHYRRAFALGEPAGALRAAALLTARAVPPADGGPTDAVTLLEAAVTSGYVPANGALAELVEYGAGVARDWPRARLLYGAGCRGKGKGKRKEKGGEGKNNYESEEGTANTVQTAAAANTAANANANANVNTAANAAFVHNSATTVATAPDADACYHLALMLAYGRGGGADYAAAHAAAAAASQAAPLAKHGPSELLLGNLHAAGQGVPIDYDAALAHYFRSISTGDVRCVDEATSKAESLGKLVDQARAETELVMESFAAARREAEPDASGWL